MGASESKKPHYMRGGVPGKIDQLPFDGIAGIWAPKIKFWDPLGFTNALSEEEKAKKAQGRTKERPSCYDWHYVVYRCAHNSWFCARGAVLMRAIKLRVSALCQRQCI